MTTDRFYADIYVHLHADEPLADRRMVDQRLLDLGGVFSVHFEADVLRDAMYVSYNPAAVTSETLIDTIRGFYPDAVKAAKILTRVSTQS